MQASVSVVLQTFQLHAVEMSNQPLLPVLELFVDLFADCFQYWKQSALGLAWVWGRDYIVVMV